MASSDNHDNQKSLLPNNLLLDSTSIHLALAQPGAHPSIHEDDKIAYNLDRLQKFNSIDNIDKCLDTSINNEILFQEPCFYCTVDSYMSGMLTLNWNYIFFKPDFVSFSENQSSLTNSLFIPIDNFCIVEWATTYLPEKIESRPDGWELKLFYSLKLNSDESRTNENYYLQNKNDNYELKKPNKLIIESSSDQDNFHNIENKILSSKIETSESTETHFLKTEFIKQLQYEICSIFIFDSFNKLDQFSKWLNALLQDKPYCMQLDFDASASAIAAYFQSSNSHNISNIDGVINRQDNQDFYENFNYYSSYFKFKPHSLVHPIISQALLLQLGQHLPVHLTNCSLEIAFSPNIHGVSFSTFYNNLDNQGPFVMLIKDNGGTVFGAFIEKFERHSKYYGTDTNFVFTFKKLEEEYNSNLNIKVFTATSNNNFYIFSDSQIIAIGGGGHYALTIEKSFFRGSSTSCTTFNNISLSSTRDFIIKDLQIWKFISPFSQ